MSSIYADVGIGRPMPRRELCRSWLPGGSGELGVLGFVTDDGSA